MSSGAWGAAIDAALGFGQLAVAKDEQRKAQHRYETSQRQSEQQFEANKAMQYDFAKNGLRWKVEEAKSLGIHPLAVIGSGSSGFSPIATVGGSNYTDHAMSDALGNMGQNISRSINATKTEDERLSQIIDEQVKQEVLKTQLMGIQVETARQNLNPSFPQTNSGLNPDIISGQSNSKNTGTVQEVPTQRTHSRQGVPEQEAGMINDYGFVRTKNGIAIVPSTDVKNRIEDQIVPELLWAWRNNIKPNFVKPTPPDTKTYHLPEGYDPKYYEWDWSILHQEFRPTLKKRYQKKPKFTVKEGKGGELQRD